MHLPFKSTAGALLFSVFLGPVGVLYASIWGGCLLILLSMVAMYLKLVACLILIWLFSCILSVAAVSIYNKKIYQGIIDAKKAC